jgi:hypothetical protein
MGFMCRALRPGGVCWKGKGSHSSDLVVFGLYVLIDANIDQGIVPAPLPLVGHNDGN